jgi:hypothetical protein
LSREIPEDAVIKTLSIKKTVSDRYAGFAVEVPAQPLLKSDAVVGIDLGIENFAALSDGTMIQTPRLYEHGQAELRVAQRRVTRRKKGSIRRRKAVTLLGKPELASAMLITLNQLNEEDRQQQDHRQSLQVVEENPSSGQAATESPHNGSYSTTSRGTYRERGKP